MAGQVSEAKERTIAEMSQKSVVELTADALFKVGLLKLDRKHAKADFAEAMIIIQVAYDSGERAGYQRALEDAAKRSLEARSQPPDTPWEHGWNSACRYLATEIKKLAKGKEGSNG